MVTTIFDDQNLVSWIWIVLSVLEVTCVAGGIVSTREIKFWRRSRQASGKAAREDKGEREFLAALPLAFGGSTPKTLFRKRHTATYAGQHARDL